MNRRLIHALISLGLYGNFLYFLGLVGGLNVWTVTVSSVVLMVSVTRVVKDIFSAVLIAPVLEKSLVGLIFIQCTLYSLGLFVPETGFDALWYHLPEAQVYAATGAIQKITEISYSTMPRLGEMFFIPTFYLPQPMHTIGSFTIYPHKIVSYVMALVFITLTYRTSRLFLSRAQSSIVVLMVNSVYVISWLSSSGYIDITRAIFELASLYCAIRFLRSKKYSDSSLNSNYLLLSGVFAGFALSTKMHSFIHLFIMIVLIAVNLIRSKIKLSRTTLLLLSYILTAIITALPWYIDNYLQSGHPFFPLNNPVKQLDQFTHAGTSSLSEWLFSRIVLLPFLFWDLTFNPTDYLTPVFLILLPIVITRLPTLSKNLYPLLLYSSFFLFSWWFLPPPETRYLLTSLPLMAIICLKSLVTLPSKFSPIQYAGLFFVFISICLTLTLRLYSSRKYLPVILSQSTPQEYLNSQTNDFNHDVLTKYHSNYWLNYQYK